MAATERASTIPVKSLRQIFTWPLVLREPGSDTGWYDRLSAHLSAASWMPLTSTEDLLDMVPAGATGPCCAFRAFLTAVPE